MKYLLIQYKMVYGIYRSIDTETAARLNGLKQRPVNIDFSTFFISCIYISNHKISDNKQ